MAREEQADMLVTEPTLLGNETLPAVNAASEDDCSSTEGEVLSLQIDGNNLSFYIMYFVLLCLFEHIHFYLSTICLSTYIMYF